MHYYDRNHPEILSMRWPFYHSPTLKVPKTYITALCPHRTRRGANRRSGLKRRSAPCLLVMHSLLYYFNGRSAWHLLIILANIWLFQLYGFHPTINSVTVVDHCQPGKRKFNTSPAQEAIQHYWKSPLDQPGTSFPKGVEYIVLTQHLRKNIGNNEISWWAIIPNWSIFVWARGWNGLWIWFTYTIARKCID